MAFSYRNTKITLCAILFVLFILLFASIAPATSNGLRLEKNGDIVVDYNITNVRIAGEYDIVSGLPYSFENVDFRLYLYNSSDTMTIVEGQSLTIPANSSLPLVFDVTVGYLSILPYIDENYKLHAKAEVTGNYMSGLFSAEVVLEMHMNLMDGEESS